MKSPARLVPPAALLFLLASCVGGGGDRPPAPIGPQTGAVDDGAEVSDDPVKIGAPYQVGSVTYTPADPASYDEVGYASWYGAELAGRPTARGEPFNPEWISAAHKTLPLPSYVEVTALDTGRTILVRVNDRGPFASDRLIDLSEGAARQLGILGRGDVGVRVRRVRPIEQEKVLLRSGRPAADRLETPKSLLTVLRDKLAKLPRPGGAQVAARPTPPVASGGKRPVTPPPATTAPTTTSDGRFIVEGPGGSAPAPRPAPPRPAPPKAAPPAVGAPYAAPGGAAVTPAGSGYVVQVASFSSRARADAMAKRIGARVQPNAEGTLYRVRYGPYPSEDAARAGLESAKRYGYSGLTVTRE